MNGETENVVRETTAAVDSFNPVADKSIRMTLLHFGRVCCWTRGDGPTQENIRKHLMIQGLSRSAIDWVLS